MPFEVTEQNLSALDPLFQPWEEPTLHRVRNPQPGQPALIQPGRRPSRCALAPGIRAEVGAWRRGGNGGLVSLSRCDDATRSSLAFH
jgi:type III restriction enzyme